MIKKIFAGFFCTLLILSQTGLVWCAEDAKNEGKAKKITVQLKSGLKIIGDLYQPRTPASYTFVLAHGLGSNREEWMNFAEQLSALGYGVCIYDLRGHGESRFDVDKNEYNYKTFATWGKNTPWQLMPDDMEEVLDYLVNIRGLDKNRFVLGGASLGANVALVCASRKKNIHGLILLSPGLDYAGVQTEYPMRFCTVKAIALTASTGDSYAYQSTKKLETYVHNKKSVTAFYQQSNLHGVNMFKQGLDAELLIWIRNKLK